MDGIDNEYQVVVNFNLLEVETFHIRSLDKHIISFFTFCANIVTLCALLYAWTRHTLPRLVVITAEVTLNISLHAKSNLWTTFQQSRVINGLGAFLNLNHQHWLLFSVELSSSFKSQAQKRDT